MVLQITDKANLEDSSHSKYQLGELYNVLPKTAQPGTGYYHGFNFQQAKVSK